MNKRGQFYLLAAIIIISVLIGFAFVKNSINKKNEVKIYYLGDEVGIESGVVLDHGTYKSYDDEEFASLLANFTEIYAEFAGTGKELYFIFGNKREISVASYLDVVSGHIFVGGTRYDIIKKKYFLQKIKVTTPDKVEVIIGDNSYIFELKEGQNFYFVISQEVSGEVYIKTNK